MRRASFPPRTLSRPSVPCARPGHLHVSRPRVHVLACPAPVLKGQQPGREGFRRLLPAPPPLFIRALPTASLLATLMAPRPRREEGHPAWPGSHPPAAECLPSACLIWESFTGCPSRAALLFLESGQLCTQACFEPLAAVAFKPAQVKSACGGGWTRRAKPVS